MSAIGTKQTSASALHMSAFGLKRTLLLRRRVSVFDPKRAAKKGRIVRPVSCAAKPLCRLWVKS